MMTFSCVDLNSLTNEEKEYYSKINEYVILEPELLSKVYVVKDNNDIKSVFCIETMMPYYNVCISAGTKKSEQQKGYFAFGFYMINEILRNSKSIKTADFDILHEASRKMCEKCEIDRKTPILYRFQNPNFNNVYEKIYIMIEAGMSFEEIENLAKKDEEVLEIAKKWYNVYNKEVKSLEYTVKE